MINVKILVNPILLDTLFKEGKPPVVTFVIEGLLNSGKDVSLVSDCPWYDQEPDTEVFIQVMKTTHDCEVVLVFE